MSADMKEYKVGVFAHPGVRKPRLTAYTVWYNPDWGHCCEHKVWAFSGTEAKRIAMREHREHCMEKAT